MNSEETKTKVIDPDFPFYNDNPKIETWGILLLAAVVVLLSVSTFLEIRYPWYLGPILFCSLPLAAFLIVARGRMSLIVKKFKVIDFVRIIVTLILQYVFVIAIGMLRNRFFHAAQVGNSILDAEMDAGFWIQITIQLFGEEMYKLLIFLVALVLIYKLTGKRTMSVVTATAVMLLCFALIHASSYQFNWTQILINQGIATFFCMYNYLRSKNILTSYIQHMLLGTQI